MLKANMESRLIETALFLERIAKKIGNITADIYNYADDITKEVHDGKEDKEK